MKYINVLFPGMFILDKATAPRKAAAVAISMEETPNIRLFLSHRKKGGFLKSM